jgi:hypothetical protein
MINGPVKSPDIAWQEGNPGHFLGTLALEVSLPCADNPHENADLPRNVIILDIATDQPIPARQPEKERRRARRFHCDGLVEVNRIPSTGKREGKLKDLSQNGCQIETDRPFPVPSYVEVMIRIDGMRLRLTGTVKSSRKTRMGIEFDQISASGKNLLQEFIVELEKDHDSGAEPTA